MRSALISSLLLAAAPVVLAAKASLPDPLFATYWGQTSGEKSLKEYCATGYFNVISIGFIDQFGDNPLTFETDGCSGTASSSSACTSLASQITSCQKAGVKILVSLGGGTVYDCGDAGCTGNYTFVNSAAAQSTATQLWQSFFNGGKTTKGVWRPFGSVVVDGIDLDIEMVSRYNGQNPQAHYGDLINGLLSYDSDIIIGAAPECQWGSIGENPLAGAVTEAPIDFLFVQIFNNAKCSFTSSNYASTMQHWASVAQANSKGDTRLLVGLPGDTAAALLPSYYVSPADALSSVESLRSQFPGAHVGVGVWAASSSVDSTASGSDPDWAQKIAKGLAAMPASASSVAAVGSSTLAAIVGNATSTSSNAKGTQTRSTSIDALAAASGASGTSTSASSTATVTGAAPRGTRVGSVAAGLTILISLALSWS